MLRNPSVILAGVVCLTIVLLLGYSTENRGTSWSAAAVSFVVISLFMTGPYFLLAGLAYFMREQKALSMVLFGLICIASVLSLGALMSEIHDYLNRDKTLPEGQRLGIFGIGIVQWLGGLLIMGIWIPLSLRLQSSEVAATRK